MSEEFEEGSKLVEQNQKLKTKMGSDQKYILWKVRGCYELYLNNTWIESNQCFICDKWRYSVFMYSSQLASKIFVESYNIPAGNF